MFTNIKAIMKYTSDLALELSKTGKKYEDPQFGPVEGDEYAQKSLFFDEIQPGAVLPEDIIWLRPE